MAWIDKLMDRLTARGTKVVASGHAPADVTPPTGSSIGAKATYAKLKILSGASFDRSFAKSMVKDHQEDIKEYRQEATKADAAGRLAKETLPILQKHLQEAQSLEKQTAQKQSSR